jgi:putative membrane protein
MTMKKTRWLWIALAGILVLALIFGGLSLNNRWHHVGYDRMRPGMIPMGEFGALGWVGMFLIWLIPASLFVLVVLGIIGLARGLTLKERTLPEGETKGQITPQEILKTRYANGEITREEFLQMKEDLS